LETVRRAAITADQRNGRQITLSDVKAASKEADRLG